LLRAAAALHTCLTHSAALALSSFNRCPFSQPSSSNPCACKEQACTQCGASCPA
jgi:hypothetical protein